jgi:hypothetical protein
MDFNGFDRDYQDFDPVEDNPDLLSSVIVGKEAAVIDAYVEHALNYPPTNKRQILLEAFAGWIVYDIIVRPSDRDYLISKLNELTSLGIRPWVGYQDLWDEIETRKISPYKCMQWFVGANCILNTSTQDYTGDIINYIIKIVADDIIPALWLLIRSGVTKEDVLTCIDELLTRVDEELKNEGWQFDSDQVRQRTQKNRNRLNTITRQLQKIQHIFSATNIVDIISLADNFHDIPSKDYPLTTDIPLDAFDVTVEEESGDDSDAESTYSLAAQEVPLRLIEVPYFSEGSLLFCKGLWVKVKEDGSITHSKRANDNDILSILRMALPDETVLKAYNLQKEKQRTKINNSRIRNRMESRMINI